ncbi:MAG: hypothetical protein O7C59_06025 [Rickettsia endosymbiont of Ixodes persulcatus]|nr:hypothetical protein [Rickettsia endosymbiont of Ixodes persulcatus]
MIITEKLDCFELLYEFSEMKKNCLKKLEPSCCIKKSFTALKPGKYAIKAILIYNEGDPVTLKTSAIVESKMEIDLNVGCIMITYTLTRLSLKF